MRPLGGRIFKTDEGITIRLGYGVDQIILRARLMPGLRIIYHIIATVHFPKN